MLMNLEELSRMTEAQLRAKANEHLAPRESELPGGGTFTIKPDLGDAQFFIDEIERRKQSRTGLRDLILELIVIVLIGAELYYGIHGGNQQLAVLQTLNASAGQQLAVLQKLNASADDTAKTMKSLREEQDGTLTAQQQTLQIITQMNGALQTELGLNFAPALTITYDESQKWLVFQNFGKTRLALWGSKLNGIGDINTEPRIIAQGTGYKLPVEDVLKVESARVPKDGNEKLTFDVYLKTADDKSYVANYYLVFTWKNDTLTINTQMIGIKQEKW
jgi:hypothetical protein